MKKSPASWLTTAILAVGIGVVTTLTLLVGSLIYASATGDSLRLPGVLEYQESDDVLAAAHRRHWATHCHPLHSQDSPCHPVRPFCGSMA